MPRVLVLGLDCATPQLVFERYRSNMPHLSRLMDQGLWGPLRSVAPPITVPAWACMTSGRDPGELGLYGFRNRILGEYGLRVVNGQDVGPKRVWDYLGDSGYRVSVLFVPQTHPPRPVHGSMISGFLRDDGDTWAYPPALQSTIEEHFGAYRSDIADFRNRDRNEVFEDIVAMTEQHFAIARTVWGRERPDFMMMVEIGLDRFHHVFWEHIEPTHRRHDPNNPWLDLGRRYYGLLDRKLGRLLELLGEDTTVLVVSDHGARNMHGGFAINQWLMEQRLLTIRGPADGPTQVVPDRVDWPRTKVWAEGGYYGRVFINVKGREAEGSVPPEQFEAVRRTVAEGLTNIQGPDGRPLKVSVQTPEACYRQTRGFPPDLMVYVDDLNYRVVGTVGHPYLFIDENDTGPDGCNHDWEGIFVIAGPGVRAGGRTEGAELADVTKTVLDLMDVEPPASLLGRSWRRR